MSDTLLRICEDKKQWVEKQKILVPLSDVRARAADQSQPRGFYKSLANACQHRNFGIIAEIKKASPSKHVIRKDFNPIDLAVCYQNAGANAISILTDIPYFQGCDEHFLAARSAITLPMIRKDFMIDLYQIDESRALGADCVLLIMSVLSNDLAQALIDRALFWNMDILIEVHNLQECIRALELNTGSKPHLIGVNNRNLNTLHVNINTSLELARILEGKFWIAESGINNPKQIDMLNRVGAKGFLIGESLMRQQDVGVALQQLILKSQH